MEDPDLDDYGFDEDGDEDNDTVPCPNCGEDIFDDAPQCPYCGMYVIDSATTTQAGWVKWTAIILIVAMIGWYVRALLG